MSYEAETEPPEKLRVPVPYLRAALGYFTCAALGGGYVSFWFRHGIFSDEELPAWDGFYANLWLFVPMAFICCLPTFFFLRWVLHNYQRETPLAFALMWAASATGVFVLFLGPAIDDVRKLGFMAMVTTVPGAVAGLIYYWIEQPGRTEKA